MKSFPQPCVAPSESARLEAEQGHPNSATFAKDFSDQQTNPSRPLREPISRPHPATAGSAKASVQERFSKFSFLEFRIPHFAFPNQIPPSPLNPRIPRRLSAAFSLTEVVIAMGVAAVAFTSIIALFPLGLNMSKESYEATQAALIAQAIMADLSDQTSTSGGKLIQKTGSNDLVAANYETISMSGSSSTRNIYLAYAQDVRADSSNSPIMLRPTNSSLTLPDWYTKGTNGSVLLVKVTMDKTFHFAGSGTAPSRTGGYPQKVDVSVESPASAPATNRTQHLFSGVIPYK